MKFNHQGNLVVRGAVHGSVDRLKYFLEEPTLLEAPNRSAFRPHCTKFSLRLTSYHERLEVRIAPLFL